MLTAADAVLRYQSLQEWAGWQARQRGVASRLRGSLAHKAEDPIAFFASEREFGEARVLVAVDSFSPSQRSSLIQPGSILLNRQVPIVLLTYERYARDAAELGLSRVEAPGVGQAARQELSSIRAVISAGDYLTVGKIAWSLAAEKQVPYFVVQHGILTPFAPPLAQGTRLLAWNEADARFWCDGRADTSAIVVGSQTFWEARESGVSLDSRAPFCFLGQLHGAELARSVTRRTVRALRGAGPFAYRPHPAEDDLMSRLDHWRWRHQGVSIVDQTTPLLDLRAPVGAIFSTGILEAAAAGLPAFGVCQAPPRWVSELWERYEIEPLGSSTGTKVRVEATQPAEAIADLLEAL